MPSRSQRSCDHPSAPPLEVPGIISSELEKPKSTFQPVEDHAVSPEVTASTVPVAAEPSDARLQWNSERCYPMRNQYPPGRENIILT